MLAHLIAQEIITTDMQERIMGKETRKDKVQVLLRILPTRGPRAFGVFVEALRQTQQPHIAEQLENTLRTEQGVYNLQQGNMR